MTMGELYRHIRGAAGHAAERADLPDFAAELMSRLGFLPGAPLTRDQWISLQSDNVVAPQAGNLSAFGIDPVPLSAVAPEWLGRVRAAGRFSRPPTPLSAR